MTQLLLNESKIRSSIGLMRRSRMAKPMRWGPAQDGRSRWIVGIQRFRRTQKHIIHDQIDRSRRQTMLVVTGVFAPA